MSDKARRPDVQVRETGPDDVEPLRELCRRAIRSTGLPAYSAAQVEAWSAFTDDEDGFRSFVLDHWTLVAESEGRCVGFGGLGDGGSIASLYVDPDYGRLGIATRLLDLLIREALRRGEARLHAAASRVSLPVFRQAGFEIESEETVERRGIPIERFLVAREGAPGR